MKKYIVLLLFAVFILTGCSVKNKTNLDNKKVDLPTGVDFSFLKETGFKIVTWNTFVDNDNNVYDIVKDKSKSFSNGKKYKPSENGLTKIKEYAYIDNRVHVISDNNKEYCSNGAEIVDSNICRGGLLPYIDTDVYNKTVKTPTSILFSEKHPIQIFTSGNDYPYEKSIYITNNKVYVDTYRIKLGDYNLPAGLDYSSKGELYFSDDYGKILFIKEGFVEDNLVFKYILTDKGLYEYQKIETEESKRFEDVKPEYKYLLNDKYESIKNQIIYNDLSMVITDDYRALNFEELFYEE